MKISTLTTCLFIAALAGGLTLGAPPALASPPHIHPPLLAPLTDMPSTLLEPAASKIAPADDHDEVHVVDVFTRAAPSTVSTIARVSAAPDGLRSNLQDVSVVIDTNPVVGVSVGAGSSRVGIGLPFAAQADTGFSEMVGSLTFDNNNDSSSVTLIHQDGAVQIGTVIESATAPTRFDYVLDLPPNATLVPFNEGAALIAENGDTLGIFDAPWARDATGAVVPTRYEIQGATLTQVVEHGARFAYPIVADPTYKTYTIYWSVHEVRAMYQGVQNINNVCNWLPLPYLAAVGCGAPAAYANAIVQAYHQRKRVKAVYYSCGFNYCSYYKYYVVV